MTSGEVRARCARARVRAPPTISRCGEVRHVTWTRRRRRRRLRRLRRAVVMTRSSPSSRSVGGSGGGGGCSVARSRVARGAAGTTKTRQRWRRARSPWRARSRPPRPPTQPFVEVRWRDARRGRGAPRGLAPRVRARARSIGHRAAVAGLRRHRRGNRHSPAWALVSAAPGAREALSLLLHNTANENNPRHDNDRATVVVVTAVAAHGRGRGGGRRVPTAAI